MTELEKKEY